MPCRNTVISIHYLICNSISFLLVYSDLDLWILLKFKVLEIVLQHGSMLQCVLDWYYGTLTTLITLLAIN